MKGLLVGIVLVLVAGLATCMADAARAECLAPCPGGFTGAVYDAAEGKARVQVCPVDVDGDPLPADAYDYCGVTARWTSGGAERSHTAIIGAPAPDCSVLLASFEAAKNAGSLEVACHTRDGKSAEVLVHQASFPLGVPGTPQLVP